ncbi:MAG: hypothetical protein ACJA2W_002729 [Planctomycetota bacterium]|jgi:hypothetical protein
MQESKAKEIIELLSHAAEIKTRLRQLESMHALAQEGHGSSQDSPAPGALLRAKNHLELALEALGTPTWGFASTPASSLNLTGSYSADIYKALKDIRSADRAGDQGAVDGATEPEASVTGKRRAGQPADRRKLDRMSQQWAAKGRNNRKRRNASEANDSPGEELLETNSSAASAPASNEQGLSINQARGLGENGGGSVWVQHRVDEIKRALTAAFGDDEILPDAESTPKPFAAPEFMGNTDALSVPELVGFFQLQAKTGVLAIDARQEQFSLEYLRGELIHACSSSSPDGHRLGEVLVQFGHLTKTKLERLLAGKGSAERLGDALRRGEVVAEEALAEALQYQVQNIFYRLFDLKGCRFTFREGLEGEPRARVRYNVTRLLLETARHKDELESHANRLAG